ncbi:uncharacterized protein LOC143876546 [Tasmannia lanceolata]|uniref:uncharacterized protein LOC143876546 n=1 Tax=Tasmannia lanceolata TaxID=3420 RepID=UPI0040633D57
MVERAPSDSKADENSGKSSSSEEKDLVNEGGEVISEYEKQRMSRIKENRARLEALGLPNLASSLLGSVPKHQGKVKGKAKGKKKFEGKIRDDDDEYRPLEEENGESSSSEEYEEEELNVRLHRGSIRKEKNKSPLNATKFKKLPVQRLVNDSDTIDDDISLQQAIALSLGGLPEDSGALVSESPLNSSTHMDNAGLNRRKEGTKVQETFGRRKKRKMTTSRVQMSEDEMIAYFFLFDEAGKGNITVRDLQRVAKANDFVWTDKEVFDMIDCFDGDGHGKLNLSDFRMIMSRCNMIQGSETVEMG